MLQLERFFRMNRIKLKQTNSKMKASYHSKYGQPSVLQIKKLEKPIPKNDEILVKVYAATVNRTDCANLLAKPFIMRFSNGLFKPKKTIPGTDFSGVIEDIGEDVTAFKKGDKVFGFDDSGLKSHAEFLVNKENKAVSMPGNCSFEQAAASLEGMHYARNFINKVNLESNHKVLINGATGAIGSAMVQLVRTYGCKITAVCETQNIDLTKSIGANRIIDYLKEDFTKVKVKYDFVFDSVGKSTFGKCKSILKPKGIYISSELGPFAQNLFFALLKSFMGSKKVVFPLPLNINKSVLLAKKLIEEGKFKPVIDKVYPLEKSADAFTYVLSGQKVGNVILKISE